MTTTLICPTCGLAYEDERQHRDWHVDQHVKRQQRRALAELSDAELLAGMNAALNRLEANLYPQPHVMRGEGEWR